LIINLIVVSDYKPTTPFNFFLLDMNFDKFNIGLHFLIFPMLAKFSKHCKSIAMSSKKNLNFKFYSLKVGIKNFMD